MFNETRLLDCVSYGSQFGQEFKTRITQLRNGRERRNADWALPLGRYSVTYQALKPEDHLLVRGAHMACMGSLIAFRFKDWTDYLGEHELIGEGTGVAQTLALSKSYAFGPISFARPITKPVAGTIVIYEGGQRVAASVNYTTGMVTVTAPPGSPITWSGEFDVPVRFESDRLDCDPIARFSNGYVLTADVDLVEDRQ